ncbi:sulfatase [Haloferula sp. A504]|uniref:sulfatase n=1 Tax=Haloferula sp. A504 TaxID=3373601 RepID=UPI0031CB780C|nr:sulfatase [Verrucomicrobiaceae bacterium E54]
MKALAALAALVLPASATNVVFIMADDLGYMDVGFNNPETFYDTPRLNALAKESVRFTNGYAACPVCSPTRSSVLTGQYPARTRNTDYFGGPNGFLEMPANYDPAKDGNFKHFKKRPVLPAPYIEKLDASHTTLAEALKAAGYATMHAGKWHLGPEGSFPTDHGFDINIAGGRGGGPYSGDKYFSPYDNPHLPNGPKGEHLPDRLAQEVDKFITTHKDGKFFVYLPFYSVHTPLMAPEDLVAKYDAKRKKLGLEAEFEPEHPRKNRTVQQHAIYAGMVEAMDAAVGKALDSLEKNGVADDTLVFFFSDNGGLSTSEGSPTSNLPLRAGKGWTYEGGIREPLIVRWPGKGKAGATCDAPVISTDFYPTILEACGLDPLPEQHVDGTSFAKLLKNPEAGHDRAPLFWHYPHWGNQGGIPSSAIRDGDWKLIDFYWKKSPELYHLADDPGERTNLADKHPEKLAELQAKLEAFRKDTDALPPSVNPDAKPGFDKW